MAAQKKLQITLIRGVMGKKPDHRATVRGLGLRRIDHVVEVVDTPAVRGMINRVAHLVRIEA